MSITPLSRAKEQDTAATEAYDLAARVTSLEQQMTAMTYHMTNGGAIHLNKPTVAASEYRMLEVGEVIREGDEFLCGDAWVETESRHVVLRPLMVGKYRRRIVPTDKPVQESAGGDPYSQLRVDLRSVVEENDRLKQQLADLQKENARLDTATLNLHQEYGGLLDKQYKERDALRQRLDESQRQTRAAEALMHDECKARNGRIAELEAEVAKVTAERETAIGNLIDERESAEDTVDDLLSLIGVRYEWSNLYGFPQAIEAATDVLKAQDKDLAAAQSRIAALETFHAMFTIGQSIMGLDFHIAPSQSTHGARAAWIAPKGEG